MKLKRSLWRLAITNYFSTAYTTKTRRAVESSFFASSNKKSKKGHNMQSNFQLNRTITNKKVVLMDLPHKAVSQKDMESEWLVIQAAQSDPTQFRPLYNRYYETIFRFIHRRTNEESLSADICSQVFLKAMQKLGKYQFKGVPFSAWLYRIASNEVAQHFRNASKNRIVSADDQQLNNIIDEVVELKDERMSQLLISALDQLKEKDLEIIELRFFEKRPFKEIADILGITESNAKVKTYRILEKLKKQLAPQK